ncbi:HmuY family protein [Marinospirillum sp. MEB164]|uniref:HmuY family protein n=1 Tax=Marinospirillum alkalitolerans TaxID=3123374 RepID=A0ABW8PYS4_9GAMM
MLQLKNPALYGLVLASSLLLTGCSDSDSDSGSDQGLPPVQGQQVMTLDATSQTDWVYLNLITGQVLDAEAAANSTDWHLAARRMDIKLNSGASGPGQVRAALVANQNHLYDQQNQPIESQFLGMSANSELYLLDGPFSEPNSRSWVSEQVSNTFGMDWADYNHANGLYTANNQNGWILRSASGDAYAKMRMTALDFPTRAGQGIQSFAFDFYVQKPGESNFSTTPITWNGGALNNGSLCFSFVNGAEVACTGNHWDLQIGFEGRDFFLRTNSGPNGEGQAGSFGPFAWSDQATFVKAGDVPPRPGFAADTTSGIFGQHSWYAYGVGGGHQLWPNYRVYLIDTDGSNAEAPRYALQVIGYYNDAGQSGHMMLRYQEAPMQD